MDMTQPGSFDFRILDMNRHRLAHCPRTDILSGSGALRGVYETPEDDQLTEVEGIGKLSYQNGTLKTKKLSRDGTTSTVRPQPPRTEDA